MEPRAFLIVSAVLFSIGVMGFLTRRNLLVIFLSIELMLNAAALALITFARLWPTTITITSPDGSVIREGAADGHVLFFLVLALAAAESAVGLSLVIAIYRKKHGIEAQDVAELRG